MESVNRLFLSIIVLFVSFTVLLNCNGDDDGDDGGGDDDSQCIICETTAECTEALGPGWVCVGGCCEEFEDDDATDDDVADDDTVSDDDVIDDDAADDDTTQAGEVDFIVEDVDRSAPGNRQTATVTTADGAVHIAYTGCSDPSCDNSEMFYGVKTGKDANWQLTSVDSSNNDTGWFPGMDISSQGTVYLTYANHDKKKARFAYKTAGGDWVKEPLGLSNGGWWTSCVLIGDQLVMAHTKTPLTSATLEAGYYSEGNWTFSAVDTSNEAGWYTSIDATPDNRPVISYMAGGYPVGYMMVAEWTGTEWDLSNIDGNSIGNDVAVDADGYIHLVYSKVDPVNSNLWDLWYATNAPAGEWNKYALDSGASEEDDTGGFPHIAIDAEGGLHVSYRHFSVGALRYARNFSGEWEFHVADNIGGGLYSSIAIDNEGGVHLTYEDGITVHYAYCETCAMY